MYALDHSRALKWADAGGQKYLPENIDLPCPEKKCRRSLSGARLNWQTSADFAFALVQCAVCGARVRFFLVDPPRSAQADDIARCHILVVPPQTTDLDFDPTVAEVSPAFARIYAQAAQAELLKLDDLAGMGYRKALEFLVKDYLSRQQPDLASAIAPKRLAACIAEHVTDERIKSAARMAVWVGNDETHYLRKHSEMDVHDLKALLKITVHWISDEISMRDYDLRLGKKQ